MKFPNCHHPNGHAKNQPNHINEQFFTEYEISSAVTNGDLETLKNLLENRIDKNPIIHQYPTGITSTVLHEAATFGQVEILKYFKDELKVNFRKKSMNSNFPPETKV